MADILTSLRDNGDRGRGFLRTQMTGREQVMMMLGRFLFSLASASPQQIGRRTNYNWASQDIVGGRPVLQNIGPGAETIELPGRIYPYYKGGLRQVAAMRELAGLGTTNLLIDALGFVYGDYAITEVEETSTVFDAFNVPRRIDFRLALTHAGGDSTGDGGNVLSNLINR